MIECYISDEMRELWSVFNCYKVWFRVELVVLDGRAVVGELLQEMVMMVKDLVVMVKFNVEVIRELQQIEVMTCYDVMVFFVFLE